MHHGGGRPVGLASWASAFESPTHIVQAEQQAAEHGARSGQQEQEAVIEGPGGRGRRQRDHRCRAAEQGQAPKLSLILEPRADDLWRAVIVVLRVHC